MDRKVNGQKQIVKEQFSFLNCSFQVNIYS